MGVDNVLYIGPYRESSGMGNASRAYIRSLIKTGVNLSIRPIYNLHKDYPDNSLDDDFLELEDNYSKKYHTCIQHCYPHQLYYNNKFDKHIGILHFESSEYKSNILQYLSLMDSIVVGSIHTMNELKASTEKRIFCIHEPINIEEIEKYRNDGIIKKEKGSFSFYTISDWISRKNIDKIIIAFLKIATYYPNIELVIKTKSHSGDDTELKTIIEYELSKIYKLTKISIKPKIVIGEISKEGMYYIHHNNDCYINISSGESFSYSCLEALAFNNQIIVNRKTSQETFTKNGCGLLVDTETEHCVDRDKIFPIYNTENQYWVSPILKSLQQKMFEALIETKEKKETRINAQKQLLPNYSIDNAAKLFNSIL